MRCFISFSEQDAREVDVRLLIEKLEERTKDEVEYLAYFQQSLGHSLTSFMTEDLGSAHACIILLGPNYYSRISNVVEKSGVYREYDLIVSRLEDKTSFGKPIVIPVHWAGNDFDSVTPTYFKIAMPLGAVLTEFRASGTTGAAEHPFIPAGIEKRCAKTLDTIADALVKQAELVTDVMAQKRLEHRRSFFSPAYLEEKVAPHIQRKHTTLQHNILTDDILQLKYERGRYDAGAFAEHLFTKTHFFHSLRSKTVSVLSGRKGSGKTTLVQFLEYKARNGKYFPVIEIEVDGWNLHYLIQGSTFTQADSDFAYADLEVKFFGFVWFCFAILCMVDSLGIHSGDPRKLISSIVIDSSVAGELRKIEPSARGPDGKKRSHVYAQLFQIAVSSAKNFFQKAVDNASSSSEQAFKLDILNAVTIPKFADSLCGENMVNLRSAIECCGNLKFLFCFDRFDTEIQQYRKDNIEHDRAVREKRARREIDWLSSLSQFVQKCDRPDQLSDERNSYNAFSNMEFLVVLPYDRVMEIEQAQRDSVANEIVEEIYWQPKELLTMLRKRIQVMRNISDENLAKIQNEPPVARFKRCLELAYRGKFPESSYVNAGAKRFQIDLFMNVLRHSFFRPRDILIYYASILAYIEVCLERGRKIEEDYIKEIISRETSLVVRSEFIGELRDSWTNIDEILDLFKGADQIMDFRALNSIIGPSNFEFYHGTDVLTTAAKKIEFLYKIGFLGTKNPKGVGPVQDQEEYMFYFVDPRRATDFSSDEVIKKLSFAVHPAFLETLYIRVNGDRPVLYLQWNDLERHDRFS